MTTILAVDDAATMRALVKGILEHEGHNVMTAGDGAEALALVRQEHFDLAIVDVNMPNMNGISFVSKVRRIPEYKNTPILMLTTETSEYKKQKARSLGANGWLTKPFDPPKLVNAINTILEKTVS